MSLAGRAWRGVRERWPALDSQFKDFLWRPPSCKVAAEQKASQPVPDRPLSWTSGKGSLRL